MRSSTLTLATLLALGLVAPAAAQQGTPAAKPKPAMTQQKPAPTDSAKQKAKHTAKAVKPTMKHKATAKKTAKPDSTKKPSQH